MRYELLYGILESIGDYCRGNMITTKYTKQLFKIWYRMLAYIDFQIILICKSHLSAERAVSTSILLSTASDYMYAESWYAQIFVIYGHHKNISVIIGLISVDFDRNYDKNDAQTWDW